MKKIIKMLSVMCLAALLSACGGGAPASSNAAPSSGSAAPASNGAAANSAKPVLTMGTNAEFPPFEFIAESGLVGQFDGIDVALAKQIADDHGYELKIENMEFDGLIAAVNTGKIDFIAAGMTVKADREENADASIKYYNAIQYIIVKKENNTVRSAADLIGKNIGVQEGTTGDFFADEDIDDATVKRYKKGVDAVLALKKGDVDAVIIDSAPAQAFVNQNDDLMIVEDSDFFGNEEYAMWVKKGNTELLEKINSTLQKMKDDGSIDELSRKYAE